MNIKLKNELNKTIKPRPRPLMFIGHHNGKKCFIRKRSLSFNQLAKKYNRHSKTPLENTLEHLSTISPKNEPFWSERLNCFLEWLFEKWL